MTKSAYPTLYNAAHLTLGLPEDKYRLISAFYDTGHVAVDELTGAGVLVLEEIFYPDYYADMPEDTAPEGRAQARDLGRLPPGHRQAGRPDTD